jgi:hypothetical protein
LALDHRADAGVSRFDRGRVGVHPYLFGKITDFQRDRYSGTTPDLQQDSGLDVGPETHFGRFHPVWTEWQVRNDIGAGLIRSRAPSYSRFGLRHRYLDALYHGRGLIRHGAANLRNSLPIDNNTNQEKDAS